MNRDEYKAALKATLEPKGPFKTNAERMAELPEVTVKKFDFHAQDRSSWMKKKAEKEQAK